MKINNNILNEEWDFGFGISIKRILAVDPFCCDEFKIINSEDKND